MKVQNAQLNAASNIPERAVRSGDFGQCSKIRSRMNAHHQSWHQKGEAKGNVSSESKHPLHCRTIAAKIPRGHRHEQVASSKGRGGEGLIGILSKGACADESKKKG